MALPSISTPEFKTKIPSTGQEITDRPFLVKEEKILLMAMEGNDQKEITAAIVKLLSNCILNEEIDVDKLATFDIEFLFLKLRGKSVGEVIELKIGHTQSECKHRTDIKINLDDINVQGDISDGMVMLTDDVGVKLIYPNMSNTLKVNTDSADSMFDMVVDCIEYIYDKEEVYNDFTKEELNNWVDTLNQSQFKKITDFFQNMPSLKHSITWKCEKCGEDDEIELEGLQSFFISA